MFSGFSDLIESIASMAGEFPGWVTAVAVIIHIVAVILCWKLPNAGTVSRLFWICVILMFPFAGIIAYLLLSVLPSSILSGKKLGFQIRSMPEKAAILSIIGAGGAGIIAGRIYNEVNITETGSFFCLDAALLAWGISCIVDYFFFYRKDNCFVRAGVRSDEDNYILAPDGEVFGIKRQYEVPLYKDDEKNKEAKLVLHAMGNFNLDNTPYPGTFDGKEYCSQRYLSLASVMDKKQFDAVDAVYLGSGVTKYTFSSKEEKYIDEQQQPVLVNRSLYRHRFGSAGFFLRCVSMLMLAVTLFSPLFVKCVCAIAGFISERLSDIIK